jgi:hypothetical protein
MPVTSVVPKALDADRGTDVTVVRSLTENCDAPLSTTEAYHRVTMGERGAR